MTITRGAGGAGLVPPRGIRPTILVVARALPRHVSSWQQSGVPVVLLPFHPGLDGLLGGLKTTDYLTALMGKMLAREHGAFEGIYQTASGEVLEGTTSNVFLANGRRLETPPVSRGILPGITRERVLAIARRNGFAVRERTIRTRELRDAQPPPPARAAGAGPTATLPSHQSTRCAGTVRVSPRCTSFSVPIGTPSSSGRAKNRHTRTDNFRSLDAKCCDIVSVWIRTNQCQDLLKY